MKITVPDIGDFKDVEVIEVLVKPGDVIALEAPLATLETEKATMDVPASAAGVVKSVAIKKGDRVSKGSVVVEIDAAAAPAKEAAAPKASPAPQPSAVKGEGTLSPALSSGEGVKNTSPGTGGGPKLAESSVTSPSGEVARSAGEGGVAKSTGEAASRSTAPPAAVSRSPIAGSSHASPSVRKFARELGADLSRIKGSGVKNRITHDDVKSWVKQVLTGPGSGGGALPKVAEIDFAKFGAVEVKPLSRIQKISGPRLHASWVNVPHVWQMDEADITELEDVRGKLKTKAAKEGIKLTPLAFIMRACVKALQEFPTVNASLDAAGQNLVFKKYIHLGFAADTPNGLVVPVVRDAHRKDVYELARDLAALSEKAREGKLSATEMQGGSFTISSLGGIGGTAFTPIINAPEVAILGVSKSATKPVFQDGKFVPRLMLPFSLAYDHRVIDGAMAVRFTTFLAQRLADVKGLLEAVP
jgi:pyruvate dehydrogenase E2 component (dihydrolipoamide acetyltransferase)